MEKIIYLLCLSGMIFSTSFKSDKTTGITTEESDSEWKLPTKNGFIYYVFDETLNNKKKELCEYLSMTSTTSDYYPIMKQIGAKCHELSQQKNNPWARLGYSLGAVVNQSFSSTSPICKSPVFKSCCQPNGNDTLTGQIMITIPPKVLYPNLINAFKKQTLSQQLKCRLELILINKNQYQLKIKGFQMTVTTNSIKDGAQTNEYYLDDLYAEFEKSENKDKEMIRFYKELNYFITSSNKIIKEAIAREIAVQELD
ncbi:MAG: hypothetical protein HY841_14445 [Bacteroidetes bacterium]|nr:hypothetical protein [Bacteroidota bacterium]